MKIKKFSNYTKIILPFVLVIFLINFINFYMVEASSDSNISITVDKSELNIRAGETKGVNIVINSITDISKKVEISGDWIENNQPDSIFVNYTNSSGLTPLSSYIYFSSTNKSEIGHFTYNITINGDENNKSILIDIIITYNITIMLKTDKNNYQNGEKIHIFGNISKTHPTDNINNIIINYEYNNWKRTAASSIKNNSFEHSYNISYGDPNGIWNITTTITDIEGNIFSNMSKITINPPPDLLRFNVLLYSPPEDAVYYRGNTINISVYVTEAGEGVNNAITLCLMSIDNIVNLTEISDGYYQGSYTIPWDSEIGNWSLSIECIKKSGSNLKAGGTYTFLQVKPAKIKLELLEPIKNDYFVDETISIIADLSYPDGKAIKDAEVFANTSSFDIELVDQQNGTYLSNYVLSNKDLGSWFIDVYARDKFGNDALTTKTIQVINTEQINIPFFTILGILIVSLFGFFSVYILKRNFSFQRLNDIESEIQEEERLQNETAVKYYKNGSISRNTYDALIKQHTERLGELKKEKRKIKKFASQKLIKWRN